MIFLWEYQKHKGCNIPMLMFCRSSVKMGPRERGLPIFEALLSPNPRTIPPPTLKEEGRLAGPLSRRKRLWIFSFTLPGDLASKNGGDFGEFFVVSVFQEMKHQKSCKFRGKIQNKIRGENSKIQGLFVLILSTRCRLSGTSVWRPQSRYTVLRIECRIKPQNQRCHAKIALHPPKSRCRTFLRTPCRTFLSFAAGRGPGGVSRRAGGGCIAALLGSENGSRYRGVSQLQSHQSCYSVQLSLHLGGS